MIRIRHQLATLLVASGVIFLHGLVGAWSLEAPPQNEDHQRKLQDETTAPIIARYVNDAGKALIESFDVDNEIDILVEEFRLAAITVLAEDVDSTVAALEADENIEGAIADEERSIGPQPEVEGDEGGRSLQLIEGERMEYGISQVQADQLFDLADSAPGTVNVCIVDSGIEDGHEDLPSTTQNGVTGTDGFENPVFGVWNEDGNGHGTHCAGVIGAIGDNDEGVVGVRKNPNLFTFHIGKGLSNLLGAGYSSNIFRAMAGCVDTGSKVISLSLGGPTYSSVEESIYDYLYDEGFLIIAAAGNEGNSEYSYPGSYKSVVSVAAIDSAKQWADFSQFNDQVELSGPGVAVRSTYLDNSYAILSGTSMACPHVAGVAAEVWSHFPTCTNTQIRNVLIRSAMDLGEEGYDVKYGYGLVQAKAAYDLLTAEGCEAGGPVQDPLTTGSFGGIDQCPDCGVPTSPPDSTPTSPPDSTPTSPPDSTPTSPPDSTPTNPPDSSAIQCMTSYVGLITALVLVALHSV